MRRYILVAGVDYQFAGFDFRGRCQNRMRQLIALNRRHEELQFQILDFSRGEIKTVTVAYPGGRKRETVTNATPFNRISQSNYDVDRTGSHQHNIFRDGQEGVMSVLNVYSAVQAIGAHSPGTLHELSFFSHAWVGGPILVNSVDDHMMPVVVSAPGTPPIRHMLLLPEGARDPHDMDPRVKDFEPPTMDDDARADFSRAFETGGHTWLWGCNFPRVVHELLTKIERHSEYRERGLGDGVVFRLRNLTREQATFLATALQRRPFPDHRNIEVDFGHLKFALCRSTQGIYAHHLARTANVTTFAGLMGTYSVYEAGGRFPLMRVSPEFGRHVRFYENYLGFALDPEGRHYGAYSPAFRCHRPH